MLKMKFERFFDYMGGNFLYTISISEQGQHYLHEQVGSIAGVCCCNSTPAKWWAEAFVMCRGDK